MLTKAIINTRVSTPEQLLNNSLNRQLESVEKAAQKLGAVVPSDGRWSGSVSSKAGTNVNRKDLLAMLAYCKIHRDVKYAIFDEYDRYMRSVNEGPYFEVLFQQLGVKVWYASETDAFNGDDAMAKLMRSMSAFRAEGSNEERQRKSVHGHEKAVREGRHTFPTKPGYVKGDVPGVKLAHPITFEPLQAAFKEVASGMYSPLEALKKLNGSSFNTVHAKWNMDKFRQFGSDPYYAGVLVVDRQVKARNEFGQHQAMITIEEHEALCQIFNGRFKPRGPKKQYNPDFPMNKILLCEDCGQGVKFTGARSHNGTMRKTAHGYKRRGVVHTYWKYRCRGCGKAYHRDDVHDAITDYLARIQYTGSQKKEFLDALTVVWQQKQKDKLLRIQSLQRELDRCKDTKSKLVIQLATTTDSLKPDVQEAIESTKVQIDKINQEISKLDYIRDDLIEFLKFSLEYTNKLKDDWWQLDHEERLRCKQLLFPAGIFFNSQRKVYTPQISSLYFFEANKKDLSFDEKSLMVELPGTAPGSVGLSWLVVYRHSSF